MEEDDAPFIITAALETSAFATFDALRRRYFPPERNFIPAHISLFHALPRAHANAVTLDITEVAADVTPFTLAVSGPKSIGSGVAFPLATMPLGHVHAALLKKWRPFLTRQDLQGFRPHIVVQNKVDASAVHVCLRELVDTTQPPEVTIIGIDLWLYRGGPWEFVQRTAFSGS